MLVDVCVDPSHCAFYIRCGARMPERRGEVLVTVMSMSSVPGWTSSCKYANLLMRLKTNESGKADRSICSDGLRRSAAIHTVSSLATRDSGNIVSNLHNEIFSRGIRK